MKPNDNNHSPDALEAPVTLDPQDINKATEWEDFVSLWMISKDIDIKNQWYKGDIANQVAVVHGENSLYKFAEEVQESSRTMEHYRRVSRAFPHEQRGWNLSWTHYLVASFADSFNKGTKNFDGQERYKWIEDAHDGNWSTSRLQAEIKKQKSVADSGDVFQYYFDYIGKVRNVLMHVEKQSLSDEQKHQLVNKMLDTYNEFMVYLKDNDS